MDDIKVTVYCITYNHEKYIRKCLESLVSQKTNFRYEILVHDDASTDKTPEIIKEFAEKYPDIVKPILQTENQFSRGISILLTHLYPATKGKYVANCEGDDYWADENKLQMQYDIMESHPGISMCVHKVQCINEDGSINEKVIPERNYNVSKEGIVTQEEFANILFLKSGYPFHTSSYFRKKESVSENIMYKIAVKINGDQRILYHALHEGDVYYIDKAMSCRRLMAVGTYNARLKEKGPQEKQKKLLNTMRAEIEFDKATKYVYHDKILFCNINRMYDLMNKNNRKTILNALKELNKKHRYKWTISSKMNIKYVLLQFFPQVIPFVKLFRK